MGTQLIDGHEDSVLSCATTSEGKILSGGENGELCMWSLDGQNIAKNKINPVGDVTSLCCANTRPDILYAAGGDGLFMYDLRQLSQHVEHYQFNEDEINHIDINEKDEYLASCDDSGQIKIVSLNDKRVYKTLRKHTNICASVSFRPRRPWDLLSGGYDKQLIQWDFSRARSVCVINMEEIGMTNDDASSYVISPPFVHSISVSNSGKYLACGTENALVQVFNSNKRTPEFRSTLYGHTQGVSQVHFPKFDDSDSILISGGNDGQCFVWNLEHMGEPSLMNGTAENGHANHETNNGYVGGANTAGQEVHPAGEPLDEAVGGASAQTPQKFSIEHGEKINWITSGSTMNQKFIVVADNTDALTVYPFPQL